MMKIMKDFKRKPLAKWVALSLVAASVTAGSAAFAAAPLAGVEIKNLATVSYEDENGNTYTAQSNEAVITVAPQYRATVENDRTQSAAPGQTVYFPHTLTNTGNIADTYDVSANAGAKVYLDTNGNGQPDAGEQVVSSVAVAAGKTVNLVVSYQVPASAMNGSSTTITMTAESTKTGAIVKDIGDNADSDTVDASGTNTDLVNITTGPVLVLNKEAVFDPSFSATKGKVTYTLTVKNTGGSDATAVNIVDALPKVDTDNDGILDTQLTLEGAIVTNGLLDAGDTQAVATNEADALVNWDVNGDGGLPDAATAVVRALDAVIAPNTTVSITYSATYEKSWAASADINNTFVAFADPDGNNQPDDPTDPPTSNTTHNEVPQNYAVNADDNGGIADPDSDATTTNDGGDDDDNNVHNDSQLVNEIASGDTVVFTHTVTNEGNGDDIFNLGVNNTDFPTGTVFTFWNADGTVQLTDSDGDGVPDTGVLGQNEPTTIVVKADLPAGASGTPAGGYNAVLTSTSSGNNTVSDQTGLKLATITAPSVDLAARGIGATQPNTGFNDQGAENAHDEGPVLFAPEAVVGSTVIFPMTVANESGSAGSFLLSSADLPSGWSVVFKDTDGNTITSTPFLPAEGTFNYTAEVTLSNDPAKALADAALSSVARPNDVDGNDILNDGNSVMDPSSVDGDKDYVISFGVTSSVDGGRTDTISHSIDVAPSKAISITPDGQNQIQPGGTVDYPHLLVNNGNVTDPVELIVTNPDPAWSSTTLIDTTGNGIPDTELANLTVGTVIKVVNPDGSLSDLTLTDTDGDGNLEFALEPGQSIKIINKVFAPADAPQGDVNSITISATDPDGTVRNTATDTSTVILGQVRLNKTVALDANCDMTADGSFLPVQTSQVEPGQCVIWNIDAKNEGDVLVKNVIVTDSIPAYTSFVNGSLKYCLSNGCDITDAGAVMTDAETDDAGEKSPSTDVVSFYLGTSSDPAGKKGGDLQPGQSATMQFTVKIDE